MHIDAKTIALAIAPLARLIGGGHPQRIKDAADELVELVRSKMPDNPMEWKEIAADAHSVALEGAQLLKEINPEDGQ